MKLGMQVGLSPGHIVLDGDPAPPPKGAQPPIFGPYLLRPNGHMDQDITWYGARPRPRRLCVRWGPCSHSPKREQSPSPQFSAHFYCGQTAGCIKIKMPLGMDVGLSPGDFVLDEDPVPLPKREMSPQILLFLAVLVWRGYMPVPWFTICVLVIIEFGLNILRNPVTSLTLFVLKIDCSMFKVTVTVTSFKNIVTYRRSA